MFFPLFECGRTRGLEGTVSPFFTVAYNMLQSVTMLHLCLGFKHSNSNIAPQGMCWSTVFYEFPLGCKLSDHRVVGLHRSEALQMALGEKRSWGHLIRPNLGELQTQQIAAGNTQLTYDFCWIQEDESFSEEMHHRRIDRIAWYLQSADGWETSGCSSLPGCTLFAVQCGLSLWERFSFRSICGATVTFHWYYLLCIY